jgi:SNF2 family DNA or RNA helicase
MVTAAPSKLYPYQERAVAFLQNLNGCAGLFQEMGTGKTRVALTYCNRERFNRVLIVCPISVASVWEQEVRKLEMDVEVYNLTYGSIVHRRQMLDFHSSDPDMPLYTVVNYEAFWRMPLRQAIQKWAPEVVILDEAHRIKGRTTRQARFAHQLASVVPRRLALTGTPVTNGIQDLFSLYKFINPQVFGTRYADFEMHYIVKGGFGGYQIIGYRNEAEAAQKIRETAFQISKVEALDLPERTDTLLPVRLDSKSMAKYREFQKHAIAEMEGKDESGQPKRGIVLARIVLSTILRLQQITSGFVTTDKGETLVLSNEKVTACKDLVEDAVDQGHQVVVFCRFLKDIERLALILPQSDRIHGEVTQKERARRIEDFQAGKIRVLICQISVTSLGIDLTAADIGVFFSTGFSLTDFLQSRDRIHRHGQTKKVSYYYLVAENTVDLKVYKALQNKVQIASRVVNLDYARQLLT